MTDQRDQNLPKPYEDMSMADLLAYVQRNESELQEWLAKQKGDIAAIRVEQVRQALQSIIWGREVTEQVLLMKIADDSAATYDPEEAVWFIRQRTDLPEETIRAVLDAQDTYMEDKGILAPDDEDIETVGPVQ